MLLSTATCLTVLASCEQNVMLRYQDDPFIYFSGGKDPSTIYSFYLKESSRMRDTVWLRVNLVGMPSAAERRLPLRVAQADGNVAVAGIHYVGFDDPGVSHWYVMPADSTFKDIPVIILRDPSMKTNEYTLELQLYPNDDFGPCLDNYDHYTVKISDMGTIPGNWSWWSTYFGEWGQVKMKFIIDYTGYSDFETYANTEIARYLKMKVKEKLAEYEAENGYLMEDDGVTIVEFPD